MTVAEGEGVVAAVPDVDAIRARSLLNELQRLPKDELRGVLPAVVPDRLLEELLRPLMQAEAELQMLRVSHGDEHPRMKSARAGIQYLEDRVDRRVQDIMKGLEVRAAAAEAQATGQPESETIDGVRPATAEEAEEIRRLQAMIRNSPDLINAGAYPPLFAAAAKGHLAAVKLLLENGADPDVRSQRNRIPLHEAVENGHKAVAEVLLASGAAVNVQDNSGVTPLHVAAEKGFNEIGALLLRHGADLTLLGGGVPGSGLETYVEWENKNRAYGELLRRKDGAPLHMASARNHRGFVELLLEAGAPIDQTNSHGMTPLAYAAQEANRDMAALLLNHEADPRIADQNGRTALHLAALMDQPQIVEDLLEHGALPNAADQNKVMPLHVAVRYSSPAIVRRLLNAGADPNTGFHPDVPMPSPQSSRQAPELPRYSNRQLSQTVITSLWFALQQRLGFVVQKEMEETVSALIEHGADVTVKDSDGRTALHHAVLRRFSAQVVSLLIEKGADVNARDSHGNTPLHWAVNDFKISQLLLENGAEVNALSEAGKSPLAIALAVSRQSEGGHREEVVKLLVEHGAVEDFERVQGISWWRPGLEKRRIVLPKGTNDWNRYTLLETVAFAFYTDSSLTFPDFSDVTVSRFDAAQGNTERIPINLEQRIQSGNSGGDDRWMEWGDIVEIPEADHPIGGEAWPGFDEPVRSFLQTCLEREITLAVGDNRTSFKAAIPGSAFTPHWRMFLLSPADFSRRMIRGSPFYATLMSMVSRGQFDLFHFRLRPVVKHTGLLKTSSDLSQVKVTRTDPETGEKKQVVFDLTEEVAWHNDLWLRDGDVIEVPDKP
ncbi:MAG TPA: ankyrin repeat domain-containing protein [Methylomirabilota bacterium]|nr:ankyrin repeat domain-containing protein [Methylomirabilota bacterium]